MDLKIDGVPTEQLEFAFNYKAPDTSATAAGIAWQDHERSIKAAFDLNLNSEDLAPLPAFQRNHARRSCFSLAG